MNPLVRGSLGESPLVVYPNGVLTLDGKDVVFMRVKLIARLFAGIMQEFPLAAGHILRDAGKELGADYVADWLLMHMPIMRKGLQLPSEIAQLGQQYEQLESQVDAGSLEPSVLQREAAVAKEIRSKVAVWLRQQPDEQIRAIWQQVLDLDVYGGWGSAKLVDFYRSTPSARIEITASFPARPAHVWHQHGIVGKPVCALLAGYLAGEAAVLLSLDDIECRETHCRLEGANACVFVIGHIDALPK